MAFIIIATVFLFITLVLAVVNIVRAKKEGLLYIKLPPIVFTFVILVAIGVNICNAVYFYYTAIQYYTESIETGN